MEITEHILLRYIKGECNEQEVELLRQWIDEDAGHLKMLIDVKKARAIRQAGLFSKEEFVDQHLEQLHQRIGQSQSRVRILPFKKFLQIAASIVVIFSLSVIGYHFLSKPKMVAIETEIVNGVKAVTLEDGTIIYMGDHSKLTYPEHFSDKQRAVELTGEAYFEVAKEKSRSFLVKLSNTNIRVLGTKFDVVAPKMTDRSAVVLVSGSVQLENNKGEKLVKLVPGDKAICQAGKVNVSKVDTLPYSTWKDGVIRFENATLSDVVGIIERQKNVTITITDPQLNQLRLVGSLRTDLDLASMMDALQIVAPIQYKIKKDKVTIFARKPEKKLK